MVRIDADALEAFARALIATTGATDAVAGQVAESLVGADARGHTSHGTIRIPWYVEAVGDVIDPAATPAVERDAGATARVDGRFAYGQVVGREAADLLAERAAEHGVAAVGIGSAPHIGRIGEWGERVAAEGLVFGAFAKSRSFRVAPAGSPDPRLPTNPVAWAVPTFGALEFDVVLDMATSQVAHGKVSERAASDEPLPEGWAMDEDGDPATDAAAYEEGGGALLPLGGRTSGYKGTGLSVVTELIAGIAADAPVAGEHDQPSTRNDAAFLAFDPTRFTSRERVRERVTALRRHLRSAEYPDAVSAGAAAMGGEALLPGEAEHRRALAAREEGVEIADAVAADLCDLARERGVDDAIPAAFAR